MSSESRWSRGHRSAGALLGELFAEHPSEGPPVVAQALSKHRKGSHGYDVVGRQQAPGDHLALLNGRAVGLRALAWLLRRRPPQVVYMPSSGLTPAAVARTMLIRLVSCKATVELVVTQVHTVASL